MSMTESEALDLEKLIADTKEMAKEKDTLARTFRGFRDYGNPTSTITSGAENAQKESEQYEQLAKMFEELKQYRAIGTVSEFRELKEKATAKKPIYSDFDENEDEEIIPYKAVCPVCGYEFEFGTWNDEQSHHCECGQRMLWG